MDNPAALRLVVGVGVQHNWLVAPLSRLEHGRGMWAQALQLPQELQRVAMAMGLQVGPLHLSATLRVDGGGSRRHISEAVGVVVAIMVEAVEMENLTGTPVGVAARG